MSILGVVVRARDEHFSLLTPRLAALPAASLAAQDRGRLVVVIESTPERSAASQMAEIALWPEVLGTALVYEYSGPDAPAAEAESTGVTDYRAWRSSLADLAAQGRTDLAADADDPTAP